MDHILLGYICILGRLHPPGQVFVWIQVVLNRRLEQAEHDCTVGCSLRRIGEQEVLPVNGEGLDAALSPFVAQLQSTILGVVSQAKSLLLQVGKCLAQGGLWHSRSVYRSFAVFSASPCSISSRRLQ